MRNLDLSPLYRSIVGFDRVANLIEAAARQEHAPNWPPYNVIQTTEDDYRIEIAVAGFGEADLDLEIKEGLLSVRGDKKPSTDEQKFLHRGIAERAFEPVSYTHLDVYKRHAHPWFIQLWILRNVTIASTELGSTRSLERGPKGTIFTSP